MKKKIIYLLVLINLISPIFANENIPKKSFIAKVKDNFSYQIQLDFEEQCKEKTSKDLFLKTKASELLSFFVPSDFLLTEDYKYYQQGKGSMLGDLYELEKKFQNSEKMPNKEMNIYIIKQLIYNLSKLREKYYVVNKIKLTNNDFEKLDKDLKYYITIFNIWLFDKTYKEEFYYNNIDKYIESILNSYVSKFEKNKNNLYELKKLTNIIGDDCEELRNLSKKIDITNHHVANYADKISRKALDINNALVKLSLQIDGYGANIERKNYQNWLKKTGQKDISSVQLSSFIYGTYFEEPNKNLLYEYSPLYQAKVLQKLQKGVLVTGNHSILSADNIQVIYLETNKNYVNGQFIQRPILTEYKGIYQYYNAFGIKNSVYKFRELTQAEINKRHNNSKYYFYIPY